MFVVLNIMSWLCWIDCHEIWPWQWFWKCWTNNNFKPHGEKRKKKLCPVFCFCPIISHFLSSCTLCLCIIAYSGGKICIDFVMLSCSHPEQCITITQVAFSDSLRHFDEIQRLYSHICFAVYSLMVLVIEHLLPDDSILYAIYSMYFIHETKLSWAFHLIKVLYSLLWASQVQPFKTVTVH